MGKEKEEQFRVIDRRGESHDEKSDSKGEGFSMKESPESPPTQLDFSTLVFSFATSALINMGVAPDPNTKKTVKNLDVARQNIEILSMLKDKTKGNLTSDESTLLENILTEVRLRFVEASKT